MTLRPIFAQIERDFDSKRSHAAVGASGILDRLRNELFHTQILCPQENADRQIEQSVQLAETDYNAYWTRIHQDYDRWRDGAMK
ncbi:hypothetical protein M427DRAFT_263974 [Gonapodya prolifera JEL478]|uniref:Uncharacterized protein n=1 Tax=Gonapodya prolifera (strain JEL478) TaxID=1344416 RepID=A0A139AK35_GONPJ|nr:hypothetical protein M427DRAFT_263974 [Gonapodya prolifera JEL478]|eukprot:KXS17131.1 hypothetical protein M427DRAFT_263974 [Gonapodya prolifera JEL478]